MNDYVANPSSRKFCSKRWCAYPWWPGRRTRLKREIEVFTLLNKTGAS